MAEIVQLALRADLGSMGVKCHTKSWEAHECDLQIGENEYILIG
jgi:hypothetical protein